LPYAYQQTPYYMEGEQSSQINDESLYEFETGYISWIRKVRVSMTN